MLDQEQKALVKLVAYVLLGIGSLCLIFVPMSDTVITWVIIIGVAVFAFLKKS